MDLTAFVHVFAVHLSARFCPVREKICPKHVMRFCRNFGRRFVRDFASAKRKQTSSKWPSKTALHHDGTPGLAFSPGKMRLAFTS